MKVFVNGTKCPICRSSGKGNAAQIITPLRSGASSSISVLATALFDELSDGERRTLIFADFARTPPIRPGSYANAIRTSFGDS